MRKFLLCLVLLFGLGFTSCENNKPDNVYHTESGYDVIYNPNFFYNIRATKIEYDGHNYIMFQSGQGRESTMGVTHDPNCKCLIKEEVEIKQISEDYTW